MVENIFVAKSFPRKQDEKKFSQKFFFAKSFPRKQFERKKIWSKNLLVENLFWSKIFLLEHHFLGNKLQEKNFGRKIFWSKIFLSRKLFLLLTHFPRKQFGWKKIWSKNYLVKFFLLKNHFHGNNLVAKCFVETFFGQKCFGPKYFCKIICLETVWLNNILGEIFLVQNFLDATFVA